MALTKVTGQVIKNTTDVTVGVLTVTNTLAVGGTVSIGGTLTYEDVTNVDAVGLITARNGIVVGSGITLSKDGDIFATGVTTSTTFVGDLTGDVTGAATQITVAGETSDTTCFPVFVTTSTGNQAPKTRGTLTFNSSSGALGAPSFVGGTISGTTGTFTGDVDIADTIVHTGDTNTKIRFPAADNISFEAGGVERLRIDNVTGNQVVAKDTTAAVLRVENSTAATSQVSKLDLAPANSLSGVQLKATSEEDFSTGANRTAFFTIDVRKDGTFSERMRITSDGRVFIGATNPAASANADDLCIGNNDGSGETGITLGSNTASGIRFADGGDNSAGVIQYVHGGTNAFTFSSEGSERVRIDSNGDFGVGLTNPTAKLHAQDDSATETDILKLRNYKSSVNTKPGLVFEGVTSSGQGANSYIRGLAGTDSGGSNSQNDSGIEFEVRQGGSGAARKLLFMRSDGEVRLSGVFKQNAVDQNNSGFTANNYYAKTFGPSSIGPGGTSTINTTNGHATGLVHIFVNRNSNAAVNRGIGYPFHLRTSGQANLGSSIYDFTGTSGAPSFTFTQANQGVYFQNNSSYTVTLRGRFELYGSVDG